MCCLMCALKVCGIIWMGMEEGIFEIRRIYIRWKHPGFYFQLLKIESQTERPILNLQYWKINICIKVLKEHVPVLDSSEFRILVVLHESVQPLGFVGWSNSRKAFKRMKTVLNLWVYIIKGKTAKAFFLFSCLQGSLKSDCADLMWSIT